MLKNVVQKNVRASKATIVFTSLRCQYIVYIQKMLCTPFCKTNLISKIVQRTAAGSTDKMVIIEKQAMYIQVRFPKKHAETLYLQCTT